MILPQEPLPEQDAALVRDTNWFAMEDPFIWAGIGVATAILTLLVVGRERLPEWRAARIAKAAREGAARFQRNLHS